MGFINGINLIRLPNDTWHNKAFKNYSDANKEIDRLKSEENIEAGVTTRFNKDNIPIGDDLLVLSCYTKAIIDGNEEEQEFDTWEIYFSIEELISKSVALKALKELKANLKCDGNPVYHENIITAPEYFSVSGPYYYEFTDVGRVTVLLHKLSIKRIKIID